MESLRAGKIARMAVEVHCDRLQEDLALEKQHQLGGIVLNSEDSRSAGAIHSGFVAVGRTADFESLQEPEILLRLPAE